MVRNYQRKTDRARASREVMLEAANKVKDKTMTLRGASRHYEIPLNTLARYYRKIKNVVEANHTPDVDEAMNIDGGGLRMELDLAATTPATDEEVTPATDETPGNIFYFFKLIY